MLSLGSAGGKSAKPSFVSYVTPEEIKLTEKNASRGKHPELLPGEVVFCSASPILKYTQEDLSQQGIFGTLFCTNFRISFMPNEVSLEEAEERALLFKNKLYGENDIPLTGVDLIYAGYDEKRKLMTRGHVKKKYPPKIIIHCKDLRVFQFSLTFAEAEEAKKIFQSIVHCSLEPKALKCAFAFSYCEKATSSPEIQRKQRTMMFNIAEDWTEEMMRTKGNCKLIKDNENFSISQRLPQFFSIPAAVSELNLSDFQGKGIPIWCWSHPCGCALYKMASFPLMEDDDDSQARRRYMERMLNAVGENNLYSVKTEELSETLPNIQEIQQSYNKFKQFFLIDGTTEFWLSDVKWFTSLESSGWLDIIRQCLHKSVEIVQCLEKENRNVLIMEEESLDLCCVISSLVQLMLDPFYRTLTGFQSLVQKEWVAGGHNFLDRCNYLLKDKELQSPVFLLFLECVWQLLQQHGPAFQFTETYLTVLSDSIHVAMFSTFLFNSPYHRVSTTKAHSPQTQRSQLNLPSVWDWSLQFDCAAQDLFTNPLYTDSPKQESATAMGKSSSTKQQTRLSFPNSTVKQSPKKGFLREEKDSLKKRLRGMRISPWMQPMEFAQASTRQFYEAWWRQPLEANNLILPCLEGPAIRLWMQRYLRWIPQAQLYGGGPIAVLLKLADLTEEVRDLQAKLDRRTCPTAASHQRAAMLPRPSVCPYTAFPFAPSHTSSSRPSIPTGVAQRLVITGSLSDKEDEAPVSV
ncbi:myotubularin-related protein 12-like isoform X1 [Conger conger]|uniref:myotubularin-related protein 12-like isoform X1 n=1 Tax=Conger conger TaxID=82655 RepID=UPI002A5ABD73|nr:myotubularin-related protein 12-like isoform X1 [Conger conger]